MNRLVHPLKTRIRICTLLAHTYSVSYAPPTIHHSTAMHTRYWRAATSALMMQITGQVVIALRQALEDPNKWQAHSKEIFQDMSQKTKSKAEESALSMYYTKVLARKSALVVQRVLGSSKEIGRPSAYG